MVARPVEQVLDELEQGRVGPLDVLEDEHGRVLVGQPLEEQSPAGKELVPFRRGLVGQAEQLRKPRLDPGALFGIRYVALDRRPQLRLGGRRLLLLRDPCAHTHHLG